MFGNCHNYDFCRNKSFVKSNTSCFIKERKFNNSPLKLATVIIYVFSYCRSVFDRIRAALDERERELYDISDGEINRKREMIEGHLKTLSEREASLNSQFNGLQQAKDDKDISQMFTGHKTAREVLSKKVDVPTDCVKDFNVTFQFSTRSDASIRQQIRDLGNILFRS